MSKKSNILPALLVLALLAAGGGYYYYKYVYLPQQSAQEVTIKKIAAEAEDILLKKILLDPLLYIRKVEGQNEVMARLPARFGTAQVKAIFEGALGKEKNVVVECSEINNEKTKSITVDVKFNDETISKIRLVRNTRPKIAVILDDWGYSKKGLPYLESIKYPFTVAVLPGLSFSREAAETAHKNGKEVMLHLPMQPIKNLPRENRMILAAMSQGEVKYVVDTVTAEIPYFAGVNNHEGSLVTADARIMDIILNDLKQRNLFFIDSLTNGKSIAYSEAKRLGVLTGKRNVFIDNKKELEYNEQQISLLKKVAKKNGWAIGIGHDDSVTLQALEKNMPLLEEEGFEFVYAAELVN
jgi:polysaccharide deacetylase 2 family uncharacterized protein YibQ